MRPSLLTTHLRAHGAADVSPTLQYRYRYRYRTRTCPLVTAAHVPVCLQACPPALKQPAEFPARPPVPAPGTDTGTTGSSRSSVTGTP